MKREIVKPDFPFVGTVAEVLCRSMGIHLCIHDLSGIFQIGSPLEIPLEYKYHNSPFCLAAKGVSWRYCSMCKNLSLKRIVREKQDYVSGCYMGISEIVKPVLLDGRAVAVIYLGNFYLKENKDAILEKIKRMAVRKGIADTVLLEPFGTVFAADSSDVELFLKTAELLEQSILMAYRDMFAVRGADLSFGSTFRKEWLVHSMKDYVLVHYYNDIRLENLAKLTFFNANYLGNLFKKETGQTFTEYLNLVRLDRAKELLADTDMKVIDISVQVGFENVTYFNRVFKKDTGLSPLEYREIARLEKQKQL